MTTPCVCNEETGVKCMLHFDLDRQILNDALMADKAWNEEPIVFNDGKTDDQCEECGWEKRNCVCVK